MKRFFLLIIIALFQQGLIAQEPAVSAEKIMEAALQEAAKTNKKIFVMFHASWCGWCKRMDKLMNDPSCKPFFDKSYVVTHIDVDEMPAKKELENSGADDIRKKYGVSKEDGLPTWLVLDKNGKLLADSKFTTDNSEGKAGANIGCPNKPEEVKHFINVLKKTTSLSSESEKVIQQLFSEKAN